MAAPLYAIEVRPPRETPFELALERAPDFGRGYGATGRALEKFGATVEATAEVFRKQHTETEVAEAKTATMRGNYELEKAGVQNPDYKGAPGEYRAGAEDLIQTNAAKIQDPLKRAEYVQWATSHALTGRKHVETAAIGRERDVNVAQLNNEALDTLQRAAAAGTMEERVAIQNNWIASVHAKRDAQWITHEAAERAKRMVVATLDERDAKDLIQKDPSVAITALKNPDYFATIDPLKRQALQTQAQNVLDTRVQQGMAIRAQVDPAGAAATIGLTTTAQQSEPVFRQGIIAIEGGIREGRGLISPAGAIGMAQLMPGTARDMLFKFARDTGNERYRQLAQLPEDQLREMLLNEHELNYQLGREYWFIQMGRYGNRIPAAAAAYNAGPARADEWVAEANRRFGPNWTAEQFASVINIGETRAYVRDLYKKLKADMGGAGLSPEGQFAAATGVQTVLAKDAAEQARIIKELAQGQRVIHDPTKLIQAGVEPNPDVTATWLLSQRQAAAAGDQAATKALYEYGIAEGVKPAIQRMQRMPVAEAEAIADTFTAMANREGTTEAFKAAEMVKTAFEATRKAAHEDPVALAERAGVAPITVINPDAQAPELGSQLSARGVIAETASQMYKVERKPFKGEEVAALKERFAQSIPGKQAQLLSAMAANLPAKVYKAGLEQLGLDAATLEAGRIALRDPALAEQVLRGHELLKQKHISVAAEPVRAALQRTLGQDLFGAEQQGRAVSAALALYTARQGDRVALYSDTDQAGIEKALQDVVGEIRVRNGIKVPTPPGMTTGRFDQTLRYMNSADLNWFGGAFDANGRPHNPRDLERRVMLKPTAVGGTNYLVMLPSGDGRGQTVLTHDGGSLIIDMKELEQRQMARLGGAGTREELRRRVGERTVSTAEAAEAQRRETAALGYYTAPPETRRQMALDALTRQEEGLERSGLGGAFLAAQRRRIAAERSRLTGPDVGRE